MGQADLGIEMLDVVLLRDGREAAILEIFDGTHFIVDVGSGPEDWDTISVTIEDIEKVIWKYRSTRNN